MARMDNIASQFWLSRIIWADAMIWGDQYKGRKASRILNIKKGLSGPQPLMVHDKAEHYYFGYVIISILFMLLLLLTF
jgi:hypothetical protein